MVTLIMASSPCRAASSKDSQKDAASSKEIPDHMPGTPARWFFPRKILQDENPSLKSGIDLEKELYYRQQAASFIHDLGMKLQLSNLVINVAMVYMHRFYVFHSFRRFPRNDIAAACIFLAAKVEEMPRKLEYIVKVSYALQHRGDDSNLDVKSNRYNEEAQKIITFENILLQTLGFDLTVAVPNQFVVKCILMVKAPKELAQAAYHFTNDCLHLTTLCLRYRPAVVACASIFLACSWAKWEIPTSHEGKPWYFYVDPEVTKEILEALAEEIVSVYQKCPERLKIKRYMGSGKREEGAGGPSTSDGGVAEELQQESALYNSITASITAAGRPQASKVVRVELELPNAQKPEVVAAVEIGASSKASAADIESSISHGNSDKKQKPVDLKSYMDRMKERRPDSPSTTAARKSFMPDVSSTAKDIDEPKQGDSRSVDRHGRYGRSSFPDGERTSAQRQPNNSAPSRFEPRPSSGLSKPVEYGRQHHEISAGDGTRKRHGEVDEAGEREKKVTKIGFDNGGGQSSNRYTKESSKSGGSHNNDPKQSVVPKSGYGASYNVNGAPWDDNREKQSRHYEGDGRTASPTKPGQSGGQKRFDDKGRPGIDVSFDDEMIKQAAQKADQMMKSRVNDKQEKIDKLKSMNMKAAASSNFGNNKGPSREKASSGKNDAFGDSQPPLPPGFAPPLPPIPPPPPPPPPPPSS